MPWHRGYSIGSRSLVDVFQPIYRRTAFGALRKRLYEAMLYNYEVENRNRKLQQMKEHAERLMQMNNKKAK